MNVPTSDSLCRSSCVPCEGGVPTLSAQEAETYLAAVPHWSLADDGKSVFRNWKLMSFNQALEFCNSIGAIAESEQHHPDLHLTGYRHLRVELTTHAIGGLSENDFILAAKIDAAAP